MVFGEPVRVTKGGSTSTTISRSSGGPARTFGCQSPYSVNQLGIQGFTA